ATPGCNAGICGLGACSPLYGDCDHNAANGCEAWLAADLNNCGSCGTVCTVGANAMPGCLNGQCGILGCGVGYDDCDMNSANGCEIRIATDPANCGLCRKACPAAPANAVASCSNSMCGWTCAVGYADCDKVAANGCEANLKTDAGN